MTWEQSGGYPEPGADRATSIAWSILDEMACRTMMHGAIREALYVRLGALVEQGDQEMANQVLHAFLDCWSMGAVVDDARERWWSAADAEALSILVRAAEIIGLAIGWKTGPAGPWPVPDSTWFQAHQHIRYVTPSERCGDVLEMSAEQTLRQFEELAQTIEKREVVAIHVFGEPSDSKSFEQAMGHLRNVLPRQNCFERAGYAAFHVHEVGAYGEGWCKPSPGVAGEILRSVADGVVVPALGTGAPMAMMGWLVWSGPHPPVRVHPISVAILKEMDGCRNSSQIAVELDIPLARWGEMLNSLLGFGAATSV